MAPYTTPVLPVGFLRIPYPSWILFGATFSSRVLGTLMAVYGIFIPAVGWKWGGIVWAYALTWFVFNDIVKVIFYKKVIKGRMFFRFRSGTQKHVNATSNI